MNAQPIRLTFGASDFVPEAVLSSTPEVDNDLSYITNYYRAERSRFQLAEGVTEVVIEGTWDDTRYIDYFAIPGSNLPANARIKLELYETDVSTTDLLNMDWEIIGQLIPLGTWVAGVDPYAEGYLNNEDPQFIKWLTQAYGAQRFKLRIEHNVTDLGAPVYGTVRKANDSNVAAVEAEEGSVTPNSSNPSVTWYLESDTGASGGNMYRCVGNGLYTDPLTSARLDIPFQSNDAGTYAVYLRVKSDGNDSVFAGVNNANYTEFTVNNNDTWYWLQVDDITVTADTDYNISVAMREQYIKVDKVVIQPTGNAAPSDTGPAVSEYPQIGTNKKLDVRAVKMGRRLELDVNFEYGHTLRLMSPPKIGASSSGFALPSTQGRNNAREMVLNLAASTDADRYMLTRFEQALDGGAFMVSAFPNATEWFASDHCFLAVFGEPLTSNRVYNDINQFTLVLKEV